MHLFEFSFLDFYVIFYILLSVFLSFFFAIAFLIFFRLISLRIPLVSFVSFSLGNMIYLVVVSPRMNVRCHIFFPAVYFYSTHYYTFTFKMTIVTMGINVEKNKIVYLNLTSSSLYTKSTLFRFGIIWRIFVITEFPWKCFIWKNLKVD